MNLFYLYYNMLSFTISGKNALIFFSLDKFHLYLTLIVFTNIKKDPYFL